ncbi:MAG: tRNA-dihydrouridine synthase [Patescibacteria group bacterium]|jgi:nifR3 family TIM-barrel protein
MISGFWKKLKKPIFAIAPMSNVTDQAFRLLIAKYGKPDVMWTEFVSCDGLQSEGRKKLLIDLKYDKSERPIVAQIFGSNPENCYKTALLIDELGFDGIDINMGCPDRNVEKQGAGSAMIKNPKLAQQVILETIRGAGKMPVSVKTRIGYTKNELKTWLPYILETGPAAVTIHARTRKEMSKVPARWEHVAEAVTIRDNFDSSKNKTLILGNGDIKDIVDGYEKAKQTGADGVMIGRGIFGNPWCFSDIDNLRKGKKIKTEISVEKRLKAMIEHAEYFEKILGKEKNFEIMKKHFKAYANGFDGAKELRIRLMTESENSKEVKKIVQEFLKKIPT